MNIKVQEYQIVQTYAAPYDSWLAGLLIRVYLNDVTYALSVTMDGTPVTAGPFLFNATGGNASPTMSQPFYQWCDGTTLRKIAAYTSFPYATINDYPNDVECFIAPVCDLQISNITTITPTTGISNDDGAVQVSATSSNGTPRFSLTQNFNYADGNSTGLFEGLLAGDYVIYSKDEAGCYDYIVVTIPYTTTFGPKYYGEYTDWNGYTTRFEIHERAYEGTTSEICFGANPVKLSYQECDKFTPYIASNLEVELLEETLGDFDELFTEEIKYKVFFYKDFGSGLELKWTGFIVPQFNHQSFVRGQDNIIRFVCSDQIGLLKDEDFIDNSGNIYRGDLSQFYIISEVIKKTNLELNIRIQDNIFEAAMDPAISPLKQAFLNVEIFKDKKCDHALEHTIKCKTGLRLFQSNGLWWIVRSEDNISLFDYIEYDIEGELIGTGTYNPVKNRIIPELTTPGVMWSDASQTKSKQESYGAFTLTHDLNFDDNLIDEGRFEEDDLIDLGNGNKGFKNWNINRVQPGLNVGYEFVQNTNSNGALYADFSNVNSTQADNSVYSIEIPIRSQAGGADKIKIAFQYAVYATYSVPWVRIGYRVRLLDSVFTSRSLKPIATGGFDFVDGEFINDIYISSYGKFETLEILCANKAVADSAGGDSTISIAFFFHNHSGRDYNTLAALKAVDVEDIDAGKKVLVYETDHTYFYELQDGNDAESSPDVLRPDGYGSLTTPKIWNLVSKVYIGQNNSLVNKVLFDNVKISYIPYDVTSALNYVPPKTASYHQLLNRNIRKTYGDDFELGDLPDMPNAALVYKGFLKLSDGTPTSSWSRTTVVEDKSLLSLALQDRITQMAAPTEIIESTVLVQGTFYHFVDCISYDGKKYLNGSYQLMDKQSKVTLKLLGEVTGDNNESPPGAGAYDPLAYSNTAYKTS